MLQQGLCLSHDPTQINIENVNRIKISPAGKLHLQWGITDNAYIEEMIKVTPILDSIAYSRIKSYLDIVPSGVRSNYSIKIFCEYLFSEDAHRIHMPSDDEFKPQVDIIKLFQNVCNSAVFRGHEGTIVKVGTHKDWCLLEELKKENNVQVFLHHSNLLPHSPKEFTVGKKVHFEQIEFDKRQRRSALFAEILE